MDDYLMHYGVGHENGGHSGRYPYGSGDDPFQHERDFLSRYNNYKVQGLSDAKIAEKMAIFNQYGKPGTKSLRAKVANAKSSVKQANIALARKLASEGKGATEIGRMMDIPEGTIRGYIKEGKEQRAGVYRRTADMLEDLADKKTYVDISAGAEHFLGVSKNTLDNAKAFAEEDGYHIFTVKIPQQGSHMTTVSAIVPPGVEYSELIENRFNIKPVFDETRVFNQNGEVTKLGLTKESIHSISPDRIKIVYNEDTGLDKSGKGVDKDGLIELRRGVDDISIGASNYAQVRIPVNDTHYIKGMAVYRDDLPDGIDIVFNTNKHKGTPMIDADKGVLKPMKTIKETGEVDWDNPFGATIKVDAQKTYIGPDGKQHYSACNIVNEEGDWLKWHPNISSQLGSKQPKPLIERQLNLDYLDRKQEFEDINALTNPVIKKKLLIEYADKCDTAAVELKAAPFPGQRSHVIIPCPDLKDNEIYAPNYKDGTVVALVRHPYAGPFESPVLTVRNTGSPAKKIIGPNAPDAVAINHKTAEQLSGADFDGDTVAVIPMTPKSRIMTAKPLKGLEGFDPSEAYPGYDGMPKIKSQTKQTEMGKVTNLITDMTLQGAPPEDVVKAVKHSMVIIDSEKHNLDYKRSERENDIAELKKKYQDDGEGHTGAGTIISRAGSEYRVDERKDWRATTKSIDEEGRKVYSYTGDTYTSVKLKGHKERDEVTGKMKTIYPDVADESGWVGTFLDKKSGQLYYTKRNEDTGKKERVYLTEDDYTSTKETKRQTKTTKMEATDDAYTLTSGGSKENPGYPVEKVYAEYANNCKGLANQARKTWLATDNGKRDPQAAKEYAEEVASLDRKLKIAESYAPKERQAVMMANRTMEERRYANPTMDKDQEKKYKTQAFTAARNALGIKRKDTLIDVTDREWDAIQAKAISPNKLSRIINNMDSERLRQLATPRQTRTITPTMESLAKSMARSGYTNQQIADRLGISTGSVYNAISGK